MTRGGPDGRRLAVGSQDVAAGAAARAGGRCAGATAAEPGTAQTVAAVAAISSAGSGARPLTGTPPAAC